MAKIILGGLLALVLLGLYVWSIYLSVQTAKDCGIEAKIIATDSINTAKALANKSMSGNTSGEQSTTGTSEPIVAAETVKVVKEKCTDEQKNLGNLTYLLNLLGALISATVVAGLAATTTDELPGKDLFKNGPDGYIKAIGVYLPAFYIFVWTICGAVAVYYGLMAYGNDPAPPLTEHAKAWLGTAVAAIYAYFGVTPQSVVAKLTIPETLILDDSHPSERLIVSAFDNKDNPIANLPGSTFIWASSNEKVAKVDAAGNVTRIGQGTCIIKATAGKAVSNDCVVTTSGGESTTPGNISTQPVIAKITIDPPTLALDAENLSGQLTISATDAQNNPIPNISGENIQWSSDHEEVATVDNTGLVKRVAAGMCSITATVNGVPSNECKVTCT